MAKINFKIRLEKLLNNELSPSSNNKNQVIAGYKSLIDILQTPQIGKEVHGCYELIFACISQIILTSLNQFFEDDQLRLLLESASNACVLSMSQNQILDGWLQNIQEREFEIPSNDEDDDDDDLYEDASESEEEAEEIVTIRKVRVSTHQQNPVIYNDSPHTHSKSSSFNEKKPSLIEPTLNQRNAHVADSRVHRGGHQNSDRNEVIKASDRTVKKNESKNNATRGSDNGRGRGRRIAPFDNKYGVDLRLYDCYICGEYGHVQHDCPLKQDNSKSTSRDGARASVNNKKVSYRSKSSSSSSSVETLPSGSAQSRIQQIYNQASKLLNSSQKVEERNQTFEAFLSLIKQLENQHGENLSKIFLEKESIIYPLFCHIAQNDFLFTNDQYTKLYHLKHLLLPRKQNILNKDRSQFSRQRELMPLTIVTKHIEKVTQIQQSIFNDFQEYVIRATSPVSLDLFNLIKHLLQSSIHIDIQCLEYFTNRILFDLKKNIFSNEQLDELRSAFDIRMKRLERNNQKQLWKERLNLFKNDKLSVDLDKWILEFTQILTLNSSEQKESSTNVVVVVVDHAMWYFAVLLMASSGHLNKEQYENLLKSAIQSSLFNSIQKLYFQSYLNQGQAPISMKELNEIKVKLESNNIEEKKLAYAQIKSILDRSKREYTNAGIQQSSVEINEKSKKPEDVIPIIDSQVLLRLISLVEMICSDAVTFSNEESKQLLDKFLQQSTIVRPLSNVDQQRLNSYYSRPISLSELKTLCSSIQSDLHDFLLLLKHRTLINNEEIFDFLSQTIVNIFENRGKFSNEKCQELKDLIERKPFGKQRLRLINETYQKFRLNKKNLPIINPLLLNQCLSNILSQDYQAHLEFFTLLEDISPVMDFTEITVESEINRCLLSTIILLISEANFSNASNIDFFRQRLKTIVENQSNFFSSLLTEQQHKLLLSRLILKSQLDPLIDLIKTNANESNVEKLINFIQNDLKDKNDFEKLINFILSTFDNEFLSIEQTLYIANLILLHSKFTHKPWRNLLQFLIDLLQLNIHSSPKVFLNLIENKQDTTETIDQIEVMLIVPNGKYAIADWKRTMTRLLSILFDREQNYEQLRDRAQQSPMLQTSTFKQQLESSNRKSSDDKNEPSTIPKDNDLNDHSSTHREMFRCLESNDASIRGRVVQQLRTYLLDEKLPKETLLPKLVQALQIIIKDSRKFTEIPLDEWATLIENNRGKIFSSDAQCDQLLTNIFLTRFNTSIEILNSLSRLIQSKKAHERHDGFQKLLTILKDTQRIKEERRTNSPATLSNQLYNTITRVVFDQKFNDNQVRQCLTAARNSCLLNHDHRQKLNEI